MSETFQYWTKQKVPGPRGSLEQHIRFTGVNIWYSEKYENYSNSQINIVENYYSECSSQVILFCYLCWSELGSIDRRWVELILHLIQLKKSFEANKIFEMIIREATVIFISTLNKTSNCSPNIMYLLYDISTFICLVYGVTDFHSPFRRTMHWPWT